jgi:hypothetical protein
MSNLRSGPVLAGHARSGQPLPNLFHDLFGIRPAAAENGAPAAALPLRHDLSVDGDFELPELCGDQLDLDVELALDRGGQTDRP